MTKVKVTGTVDMDYDPGTSLWLFHNASCEIWAQGLFYWGAVQKLQVVPARSYSMVAICTTPDWDPEKQPDKGYVIYRPANLVLTFKRNVVVSIETIETDAMRSWFESTKPWLAVGYRPR